MVVEEESHRGKRGKGLLAWDAGGGPGCVIPEGQVSQNEPNNPRENTERFTEEERNETKPSPNWQIFLAIQRTSGWRRALQLHLACTT